MGAAGARTLCEGDAAPRTIPERAKVSVRIGCEGRGAG